MTLSSVGVLCLVNSFVDAQVGWVVGSYGTIMYTSNGGQTWRRQQVDLGNISLVTLHDVQVSHAYLLLDTERACVALTALNYPPE